MISLQTNRTVHLPNFWNTVNNIKHKPQQKMLWLYFYDRFITDLFLSFISLVFFIVS